MPPIDTVTVEMFTPVHNGAVLRLPGRRFPAVVVQGDSLSTLAGLARTAHSISKPLGNEELTDELQGLRDALEAMLDQYERVLLEHGIELPYAKMRPREG